MTFEENLARLQEIVGTLEQDGLELDQALRLFEEGVVRLREASTELSRAGARGRLLDARTAGSSAWPARGGGP